MADPTQKYTVNELGQIAKTKYPQYANLDDATVGSAMLKQYPQYNSVLKHTPGQTIPQTDSQVAAATPPTKKPGFFSRLVAPVVNAVKSGADELNTSLDRQDSGQQGLASTTAQLVGNAAGKFNDIVGKAVGTVVNPVEKGLQGTAGKVGDKLAGNKIISRIVSPDNLQAKIKNATDAVGAKIEQKADEHPVIAADAKAVGNVAMVAAGGKLAESEPVQGAVADAKAAVSGIADQAKDAIGDTIKKSSIASNEETLNMTPKQKGLQARYGHNAAETLSDEGLASDVKVKDGKIDTSAARNKLSGIISDRNNVLNDILKSEKKYVNVDDWANKAKKAVDEDYASDYSDEASKVKKYIDDQVIAAKSKAATRGIVGTDGQPRVSLDELNNIKKSFAGKVNWNDPEATVKSAANNYLRSSARSMISDTADSAVNAINKHLGDLENLDDILESRDGKTAAGSFKSRVTGRVAGAMLGIMQHNPITAFAGAMGGEKLAGMLADSTIDANIKQSILSRLGKTGAGAKIIQSANDLLVQRAAEEAATPRLGAASSIPMPQAGVDVNGGQYKVIDPGVPSTPQTPERLALPSPSDAVKNAPGSIINVEPIPLGTSNADIIRNPDDAAPRTTFTTPKTAPSASKEVNQIFSDIKTGRFSSADVKALKKGLMDLKVPRTRPLK